MKAFLTPLQGLAEFEQIKEKSKTNKGILQVSGCMESQKPHLMYGLSGIAPYRLILAEDERRAREIYEDYRFYDRKVYSYPAKDLLFFQADIHGNLLIRQRMKVIKALLEEKELTVVTSIDGCMDFLESLEKIKEQLIHYVAVLWIFTVSLRKIHGESSFGEMRLILSGVLIRRVSVLWKIWKNLRSIRRWSI